MMLYPIQQPSQDCCGAHICSCRKHSKPGAWYQ